MRRIALAALAAVALSAAAAAPAAAAFGLEDLDVTFETKAGAAATQAGSHPFEMTTELAIATVPVPGGKAPDGEVRNLDITQIPGFIANPTAVETCSAAEFNTRVEGRPLCPDASAVGIAAVEAEYEVIPAEGPDSFFHVPIYNLTPPPGVAARLGFVVLNVPVVIDGGLEESPPYNVTAKLKEIPQAVLFYRSRVTLWGNPASPAHDSLRGNCVGQIVETSEEPVSLGECPVSVEEKAFLTLPRACEGPLTTFFDALSWLGDTASGEALTHNEETPSVPQGMTGCPELGFSPEISVKPTNSAAEAPTGLDVRLEVTDQGLTAPGGRAQSDIREVVVALPTGMTANPSAAEGLGVCSLAQYEAEALAVHACPESSKLGTVRVKSPLVEDPLEGALYLASQDDNPFGSLLAVYMVIRSEKYGVLIKQAGKVEPDPTTGRIVSTFEEVPQVPFSDLTVRFREGPRAPLVTPPHCGAHAAEAELTPWSGQAPLPESPSFTLTSGPNGSPCPKGGVPPFAPGFTAGSANNTAGEFSPFSMRLTRADGEQDITRFDAVLPDGLTGKIAGVAECSEAAIAAAAAKSGRAELASPSCPAASRVGRVLVGAGVGPALTYVPGTIYLAGPFGGAPLSLAVITPAVAGPFDVGTVVVREALNLNPNTAQVEVDGAASDPIPHILEGIPLKVRDLRVHVDREGFTLNPTSCQSKSVNATAFGGFANPFSPADDVAVPLGERFQAASCGNLAFKPKLNLRLSGATKRAKNPALRAELKARGGDANLRGAIVTLPPSQFIDNAHIANPCTRVQFAENRCPKRSILGRGRAFTPLLDSPLEGPVYFRSNGGERKLPDLVVALRGQFEYNLVIAILQAKKGRVRTKVLNAPDVPVEKFVLRMSGGKRGLLENSEFLCRKKQRAYLNLIGQNAKRYKTKPAVKVKACARKKKRSRALHRR